MGTLRPNQPAQLRANVSRVTKRGGCRTSVARAHVCGVRRVRLPQRWRIAPTQLIATIALPVCSTSLVRGHPAPYKRSGGILRQSGGRFRCVPLRRLLYTALSDQRQTGFQVPHRAGHLSHTTSAAATFRRSHPAAIATPEHRTGEATANRWAKLRLREPWVPPGRSKPSKPSKAISKTRAAASCASPGSKGPLAGQTIARTAPGGAVTRAARQTAQRPPGGGTCRCMTHILHALLQAARRIFAGERWTALQRVNAECPQLFASLGELFARRKIF